MESPVRRLRFDATDSFWKDVAIPDIFRSRNACWCLWSRLGNHAAYFVLCSNVFSSIYLRWVQICTCCALLLQPLLLAHHWADYDDQSGWDAENCWGQLVCSWWIRHHQRVRWLKSLRWRLRHQRHPTRANWWNFYSPGFMHLSFRYFSVWNLLRIYPFLLLCSWLQMRLWPRRENKLFRFLLKDV